MKTPESLFGWETTATVGPGHISHGATTPNAAVHVQNTNAHGHTPDKPGRRDKSPRDKSPRKMIHDIKKEKTPEIVIKDVSGKERKPGDGKLNHPDTSEQNKGRSPSPRLFSKDSFKRANRWGKDKEDKCVNLKTWGNKDKELPDLSRKSNQKEVPVLSKKSSDKGLPDLSKKSTALPDLSPRKSGQEDKQVKDISKPKHDLPDLSVKKSMEIKDKFQRPHLDKKELSDLSKKPPSSLHTNKFKAEEKQAHSPEKVLHIEEHVPEKKPKPWEKQVPEKKLKPWEKQASPEKKVHSPEKKITESAEKKTRPWEKKTDTEKKVSTLDSKPSESPEKKLKPWEKKSGQSPEKKVSPEKKISPEKRAGQEKVNPEKKSSSPEKKLKPWERKPDSKQDDKTSLFGQTKQEPEKKLHPWEKKKENKNPPSTSPEKKVNSSGVKQTHSSSPEKNKGFHGSSPEKKRPWERKTVGKQEQKCLIFGQNPETEIHIPKPWEKHKHDDKIQDKHTPNHPNKSPKKTGIGSGSASASCEVAGVMTNVTWQAEPVVTVINDIMPTVSCDHEVNVACCVLKPASK